MDIHLAKYRKDPTRRTQVSIHLINQTRVHGRGFDQLINRSDLDTIRPLTILSNGITVKLVSFNAKIITIIYNGFWIESIHEMLLAGFGYYLD